MEYKILVSYASGSGSTEEVAKHIGQLLRQDAVLVDVQEVSQVSNLDEYSAVVVGSSIRFGRWLPEAVEFLNRFKADLVKRPLALFITCLTLRDDSVDVNEVALDFWTPILQQIPQARPKGLGLFAGSLGANLGHLAEYENTPYGDYRDWDVISAWTKEIQPKLLQSTPRATTPLVLRGTILSYTDISGHDLSRFDLQNAELVEAQLNETNLQEANLRLANLDMAGLNGADLRHANLGWAELSHAICRSADFSEANLTGADLTQADLQTARFTDATMNGAVLTGASLEGANLQRCDLNWGDLRHANLKEADFSEANLAWANLLDTDLSETKLNGAKYNDQTKWPEGFDPEANGCDLIHSPVQ